MERTSSSEAIAKLNTRAVINLQEGHYYNAITELQRALATVRRILDEDNGSNRCEICKPEHLISIGLGQTMSLLHSTELQCACSSTENVCSFQVFDRVFLIPEDGGVWCTAHPSSAAIIVLFNMALCHHTAGLKAGSSRELMIALELYKMALSIVEEYVDQAGNDDFVLTLLLCLFNNMGHIHARHFDFEEARHCMKATHALLASRDLSEFQKSDDLLFFLLGSIFMSEEQLVLAPAA